MTKSIHAILLILLPFLIGCKPSDPNAAAASYPSKSITVICPWAAGGGTDRLSRFIADQLQSELGKPGVVINRTGGSGAVGHSAGALAKPDGHTITMITFELSTMHWMGISDLTWEDYEPVLQMNADAAAIIVRADAPWKNLNEFLAAAKADPGKLTMSGTSTGGAWDLARAGFQLEADVPVEAIRWIPTKGSAPSIVELLGGHIDAVCCSVPEAISQIEAGQLRTLAVMSEDRLLDYPDMPTAKESGINWVAVGWRGLAVPKGTPEPILQTIREACERIITSPEYDDFMKKNGFSTEIRTGDAFSQFLADQDSQWKTVIEAAGYAK
ncbi:MAG: tripartite tricarboxylate transporter substrate binding protein [Opitutales bacterium]|jgi:tripartite-type tricarboxylate transporter receptor subunit TctC|nr:tripartite tricarboxylate transporter substrate binding protein [Opitutales bacterium]